MMNALIGGRESGDRTFMYLDGFRFCIQYGVSKFLEKCIPDAEATVMGRTTEAKKRVVVNKFFQELNFEH